MRYELNCISSKYGHWLDSGQVMLSKRNHTLNVKNESRRHIGQTKGILNGILVQYTVNALRSMFYTACDTRLVGELDVAQRDGVPHHIRTYHHAKQYGPHVSSLNICAVVKILYQIYVNVIQIMPTIKLPKLYMLLLIQSKLCRF